MANVSNVRDSHLGGQALFEEWKQNFENEFFAPDREMIIRTMLREQLEDVPPLMMDIFADQNPKMYRELINLANGGNSNGSNIPR